MATSASAKSPASPKSGPTNPTSPAGGVAGPSHLPLGEVTHHDQGEIDVDESSDPSDSDYGDSLASDTTSLKSSIMNYEYENGRRYHRVDNKYVMPNDEREQDRLDLHHHCFLMMMDGELHYAPLENPQRILDIGTGTGIWALDAAQVYPQAEVTGTDISPIQPTWTLPNCKFEIDDAEQEWTWPSNHFDFIHSRSLAQAVRDWPRYLRQMYRCTKPGGYIQLCETRACTRCDDGSCPDDWPGMQLTRLYEEAAKQIGLATYEGEDWVQMVKDAGFTDIQYHPMKQPYGGWPKEPKWKKVGRVSLMLCETGIQAYGLALFTRVLGMDLQEAEELCNEGFKQMGNRKYHSYTMVYLIVARKPHEWELE